MHFESFKKWCVNERLMNYVTNHVEINDSMNHVKEQIMNRVKKKSLK